MARLTVHLAMHSNWRAGVFEEANIARIGRTRGRVYINKAIWTTAIIDIIGRRKYISDVVPFNQVGVLF